MKIGVGFISHNRIHLVKDCFPALLKQNFDYGIVIDNASTDGSDEYLSNAVKFDPRFQFIKNNENIYPGAARNQIVGLLAEKVDLIVFHDNDVVVPEGCFAILPEIFQASPFLGQICPLTAPKDFLIENYTVAGHKLAKTISCCTSVINVVRSRLFREGLKWRELKWHPEDNGEICEDYFLSRDIKRMNFDFAWFAESNPFSCRNIGREDGEFENDFEYYLRTFAERGMLSRLSSALPHRIKEIDDYAIRRKVPEVHGKFTLDEIVEPSETMSAKAKLRHSLYYLNLLPLIKSLLQKPKLSDQETEKLLTALETCRDYFDGIEEGHPLFNQKTLQGAIFFNRLLWKIVETRIGV